MEFPDTFDGVYELINAYLDGMTSTQFIPNSDDCSLKSQIFLNEANATYREIKYDNYTEDATDLDKLRNITGLISNEFAEAYLYCHLSVVDGYIYYLAEEELYVNGTNWFQAFLQNLVQNMIPINQLIEKITIASDNGD